MNNMRAIHPGEIIKKEGTFTTSAICKRISTPDPGIFRGFAGEN